MKTRILTLLVWLLSGLTLSAQHTLPVTIRPSAPAGAPGVVSLGGSWKFMMLPSLESPLPAGWLESGFNDRAWSQIVVPGNWETQGFKQPEYGYDLSGCTGLYRTRFAYSPDWTGQRVVLRFEGVHMGYDCWLNGHHVGHHGSANTPCNFDITPLLREDGNTLCVKVTTRSRVWKFDTVDNWTYCGINRDVTLFALPQRHIEDLTFVSENCRGDESDIRIRVRTCGVNGKALLRLSLHDARSRTVACLEQEVSEDGEYEVGRHLQHVQLWTAETPALYTLTATLCSAEGETWHRTTQRVGLREVRREGREILLNGRPIRLRGVCVSEAHPFLGNAYTTEEWRRQLLQMRQANINFVRTAHYPMLPAFYDLCDEMGLYVCDEVPLASRGGEYMVYPNYSKDMDERTVATIDRDKNHPSVIIWSLGNENRTVGGAIATLVKRLDPTRLRGFPQMAGDVMKFLEQPHPDVDVLMGHYLNEGRLDEVEKKATLPFIQTEYAHSIGLGFGEFEQKWERMLRAPGFAGGSIWCWMDGAAITEKCRFPWLKGVMLDEGHYLDSYGYLKPQGAPERHKEANDGIVYAEGTPQEDYWLVRKLYSPVQIAEESLRMPLQLTIRNLYDFRTLRGYELRWSLLSHRKELAQGCIPLQSGPRSEEQVGIDTEMPSGLLCNELTLSVEVVDEQGTCIHERIIPVEAGEQDYSRLLSRAAPDGSLAVAVSRTGELVVKEKHSGKVLVQSPFYLRAGRAFSQILESRTANDRFCWEPYLLRPIVKSHSARRTARGRETRLACQWNRVDSVGQYITGDITVLQHDNGMVAIDYTLTPSAGAKGKMTECGIALMMDGAFDTFHWLGKGLYSSVPGKSKHNERGIWSLHKDDYRFAGNRGGVSLSLFSAPSGESIAVWDEAGNIGVEQLDGRIVLSQNLHVAGYGSKFIDPCGLLPVQQLAGKGGRLWILPQAAGRMHGPLAEIFQQDGALPKAVPDRPFLKGYGW